MQVTSQVTNDGDLDLFLKTAAVVSRDHPVVISKYITGAKEVEMDAIGKAGELVNYAIAEHVENAGVHSGDATLLLPAQRLFVETHRKVKSALAARSSFLSCRVHLHTYHMRMCLRMCMCVSMYMSCIDSRGL